MVAVLGGLGAAVAWTLSTLFSSRSSRVVDPAAVVAWMAIVGLVLIAPFVIADGLPARLDAGSGGWLAVAGAGNVLGLLLVYVAYHEGAAVVLIAPLVATEGAIAAVIAIVAGESVSLAVALTLAAIAAGVSLAALPPSAAAPAVAEGGRTVSSGHSGRALALAGLAALSFGFSLYATGHVSSKLPLSWVILPARLLGTVLVAIPLVAAGRLSPRQLAPAWRLVVGAGICEVLGFASYTLGARQDVAIAAVVACQFAGLSAVAAFLRFGERLGRVQVGGVAVLLVGITVLSGIRG